MQDAAMDIVHDTISDYHKKREEREQKCEKIASEVLELLKGYQVTQLEYELIIKNLHHKVKMIAQDSVI
jgi:hypothetical protein